MMVNGKWLRNITCPGCGYRHPPELGCVEAMEIAAANRAAQNAAEAAVRKRYEDVEVAMREEHDRCLVEQLADRVEALLEERAHLRQTQQAERAHDAKWGSRRRSDARDRSRIDWIQDNPCRAIDALRSCAVAFVHHHPYDVREVLGQRGDLYAPRKEKSNG